MKKIIFSVFLLFILIFSGSAMPVLANNLPDVEVSIYVDGYPVDGTIIGVSAVNVYEAGSFDSAIDTLEPGTVVSLTAQYAYADGSNFFNVKYIKDSVECFGLVEFYSVEPIGVVITPEGVLDISDDFSFQNIFESFGLIFDLASGVVDFIFFLPNIIFCIFPFLTVGQVILLCTLILFIFTISCYFLIKKVVTYGF